MRSFIFFPLKSPSCCLDRKRMAAIHGTLAALLFLHLTPPVCGQEPPLQDAIRVDQLGIAYVENAGKLVSVALPPGARDYHLESILENEKLASRVWQFHLPRCRLSFERFKELKDLPALSSIFLDESEQANDYAASLRGVRGLKKISLARSSLTSHGLHDLCRDHPQLVELDVSGTKVDHLGVSALASMGNLESVRLGSLPLSYSPGDIEAERAFRHLARLPSLRKLEVSGLSVHRDDILALACNCHLEELTLGYGDLDFVDGDTLLYLHECVPALKSKQPLFAKLGLGTREREIIAKDHKSLLRVPRRMLRDIKEMRINSPTDLSFVSAMPELREVTLVRTTLLHKEIALLGSLPQLSRLTLRDSHIDQQLATALLSLRNVKRLNFAACDIDPAALSRLTAEDVHIDVRVYK
jgi:hypothetical protein